MNLYEKLVALKDAIPSGDVSDIWSKFKAVGDHVFGGKVEVGAATHKEVGCGPDEVDTVVADIKAAATTRLNEKGAGEVGKLGDGTLLKIIIEALPIILALFKR